MIEAQKIDITTAPRHCGKPLLGAVPYSEVYMMDCVDGMRHYPDNYFDLAIVDPPYAVGASDGVFGTQKHKGMRKDLKHYANHNKPPDKEYFDELFRVSKNQIIWGANYYPQYLYHSGWIVWDKLVYGPLSDCELAFQSMNKLVIKFTSAWSGCVKKDVENMSKIRIHPNQKPVTLYDFCVSKFAKEGDLILDTHVGSGSSRIAADKAGLNFVGFEIDEEYFNAANKRFDNFKSQTRLF